MTVVLDLWVSLVFYHGSSSLLGAFGTKMVASSRTVTLGVSVYLLLSFVVILVVDGALELYEGASAPTVTVY